MDLYPWSCFLLWLMRVLEVVDSIFLSKQSFTLKRVVKKDECLVLKRPRPCTVVVSLKEQEFLVTSILSVNIPGMVRLHEVVALAVAEKGWDETFFHIVYGIELVDVKVSS